MLDRSALIGRPTTWANWAVQAAVFGTGAVAMLIQDRPAAVLVALVVVLCLCRTPPAPRPAR